VDEVDEVELVLELVLAAPVVDELLEPDESFDGEDSLDPDESLPAAVEGVEDFESRESVR
jgi:hypothetical protein